MCGHMCTRISYFTKTLKAVHPIRLYRFYNTLQSPIPGEHLIMHREFYSYCSPELLRCPNLQTSMCHVICLPSYTHMHAPLKAQNDTN